MNKRIDFLGDTVRGDKIHDYRLLNKEFPTTSNMFAIKNICVDSGYLGIQKDCKLGSLEIPYKKWRKSKNNPDPSLTIERKLYNQNVSRKRVCVENSIAGMKRYQILAVEYRGKSIKQFDSTIEICAGLWNFKVDKRLKNRESTT